jgi:hypothetical protein
MRFENTDGDPVFINPESVLSAIANDRVVDTCGQRNQVTLVWLKGHRRHQALRIGIDDFIAKIEANHRCATSAEVPGAEL